MNYKYSKTVIAFTLAETLIVMGVIGIVSALTLPNLNSSTGNKEKIAKVKKIYQNLDDALGRADAVYGDWLEWFSSETNETGYTNKFTDRITEFMKISKDCGSNSTGCFNDNNIGIFNQTANDGTIQSMGGDYWRYVILNDGSSLAINLNNLTGEVNYGAGVDWMGWVVADIDGPNKGSNSIGKDIHLFAIYPDLGIAPSGFGHIDPSAEDQKFFEGYGIFLVTYWVVTYDNMDYLKCADKLTMKNPTCK